MTYSIEYDDWRTDLIEGPPDEYGGGEFRTYAEGKRELLAYFRGQLRLYREALRRVHAMRKSDLV